jgi:hypothetical protein
MNEQRNLDEELRRLLSGASRTAPLGVEMQQPKHTQSSAWPWQVPQVPAHTSDHSSN